jgi:hypothetical protein
MLLQVKLDCGSTLGVFVKFCRKRCAAQSLQPMLRYRGTGRHLTAQAAERQRKCRLRCNLQEEILAQGDVAVGEIERTCADKLATSRRIATDFAERPSG